MTLQPLHHDVFIEVDNLSPLPSVGLKANASKHLFCKTLTASDTSKRSGSLVVPQTAAEDLFPPLDYTVQPTIQTLIFRDLHGNSWKFHHVYRGSPKRHVLGKGWSDFVKSKRLKAGDSVIFIRDEKSQLLVGVRYADSQHSSQPSSILSADNMHIDVLAAAAQAAANRSPWTVVYNPRACTSEFVIPLVKYNKALRTPELSIGLRFGMMFETEEFGMRRYLGTIVGISALDPLMWPDSKWKNIQVEWDQPGCGEKPNRVSLWDILLLSQSLTSCSERPLQSGLSDTSSSPRKHKHQESSVVEAEDDLVQIRKNKDQENLFKERKDGHTHWDNTSSPIIYNIVADTVAIRLPVINTIEGIPALTQALWSNDPAAQIEASSQLCKLLSMGHIPLIDELIQAGVVPQFVQFLAVDDIPQLQASAAWAFFNIALGTSEHTRLLIKHGVVHLLVKLLSSSSDDNKEMAVLALGSIANDSPSTRDDVLNNGALLPLLSLLLNPSTAKLSMLKNATWTLLKLCRGKPPSPTLIEQIRPTLSVLRELLWMPDEEVVQNACLILSFITHEGSSETVQAVIKANICPRLVELLLQVLDRLQYPVSFFLVKLNTPVGGFINVFFFCGGLTKFPFYRFPMSKFIVPALQTLGHIASGDEAQTQILINSGALLCLKLLLTQSDKIILKIACLVISNITAGTEAQIQAVIDFDLIGRLVYLTKAEFDIRKEAAWAISNATYGTCEQIRSFASKECIKALYDLLTYPDPEIVTVCLKGLENILNAGEINKERGLHYGVNIYAKMVDECGGLEKIVCFHNSDDNNEIFDRAAEILMKHWPLDLEKDEPILHIHVAGSEQDVVHFALDNISSQPPSKPSVKVSSQMGFLDQFPKHIQSYIDDIVNVKADGNCGYRAIAALIGKSEDDWALVRDELDKELGWHHDLYEPIFGGRLQDLRSSLHVSSPDIADIDKGMSMPDMGYVIATTYNLILVFLSNTLSMTFFPLRGSPPKNQSIHRVICIGFVDENQWVQVFLKAGCPLPIIADYWKDFCHPEAQQWPTAYMPRLEQWLILDPPKTKIHA